MAGRYGPITRVGDVGSGFPNGREAHGGNPTLVVRLCRPSCPLSEALLRQGLIFHVCFEVLLIRNLNREKRCRNILARNALPTEEHTQQGSMVTTTSTVRHGDSEIPDKLYFRIGEVAKLCDVAPYVLRFWESEFPQLRPNKGGTGQRLYRRRDVENALRIKKLLYEEGYTIAGARQVLKSDVKQPTLPLVPPPRVEPEKEKQIDRASLRHLRNELAEVSRLLSRPSPGTVGQPALVRNRPSLQSLAKPNLF